VKIGYSFTLVVLLFPACKKDGKADIADEIFKNSAVTIPGSAGTDFKNVPINPPIRFSFTAPVNKSLATTCILLTENYRSGLIWELLTGCPEINAGLLKLGFTAPYL